jgi:hypothetical protein
MAKKPKPERVSIPYRHIQEDGTLRKVERHAATNKLYIKGTDIELKPQQICQKQNAVLVGNNLFKFERRVKRHVPKKESYNDWWNESNLDGSFAYNGVTDDF